MNRWALSLQALRRDLQEQEQEQEQYKTPCDYADYNGEYHCPYNAVSGDDCRRFCGLGVDD